MQLSSSLFFTQALTPYLILDPQTGKVLHENKAYAGLPAGFQTALQAWLTNAIEQKLPGFTSLDEAAAEIATQHYLDCEISLQRLAPETLLVQIKPHGVSGLPDLLTLRNQHRRYQAILDSIVGTAVYGYDAQQRIIFWSVACETLYGCPAEEAVGRIVSEIMPEAGGTAASYIQRQRAIEHRECLPNYEFRLQRWDGKQVEVYSTQTMINNADGEPEWFCFDLDLTALRQLERTLQITNQRLASIFDLAPAAMAVATNHYFTEVNQHWLNLFGFERWEVLNKHAEEIGYWVDLQARAQMYADLAQDGEIAPRDMLFRKRDGSLVECVLTARILLDGENRVVITSIVDVSELRATQRALETLNHELELRVANRTADLEQAVNSLEAAKDELVRTEKLVALGSMVAGIAHELNTPIGNSVTIASTLQDKTRELNQALQGGGLKKSQLEGFATISLQSAELLLRNLNQARQLMTSFKQVAMDQSSAQRRQFDLRQTIEELLETARPMYKKSPYNLVCDLAPGLMMDSYPGPLGQILTNFIANALLHAFEGRDAGEMSLTTAPLGETHVELLFKDNGQGIPAPHLSRLFDPFFTTKLGKGGNGLGLNIVYNLVTQVLGGKIRVESREGLGTTFTLQLPRCAPAQQTTPALATGVDA
ncbi:PAS domain-containing sensor histidine kinase [Parvibium lacunae]|uniref:histidine kinase n=1 Tax=Parvibium lacunae TaxID=1888893 RepID=A0A368L100_9BURK|nr:PAS domain-containing sensor histidine kinase [Parvibium lacunae]RCS57097.1 PAS domain-containing sensor histidine kinase [Parvibium lacunae]